jgi:hypothetical protein
VTLTTKQAELLRELPLALESLNGFQRRTLAALVERGCAVEEIEEARVTDAGRAALGNGKSQPAAPAKPARRGQARKTTRAEKSAVGTRASRTPAAAAPTYAAMRAEIVARYDADLAALDRVIEISGRLAALKAGEANAAE